MTRKRFIKLLMAEGCSRNEANEWAEDAKEGFTYSFLYAINCAMRENPSFLEEFFKKVTEIVERIVEVLPTAIQAVIDAIPVACERLRNNLEDVP